MNAIVIGHLPRKRVLNGKGIWKTRSLLRAGSLLVVRLCCFIFLFFIFIFVLASFGILRNDNF